MTSTDRSFPVAFRLLAAAAAFAALAIAVPVAGAQTAPDEVTQAEVAAAKAKRDAAEADLAAIASEMAQIQQRLNDAAFEVDRFEGLLEKTKVDLLATQRRIDAARARYERIRVQLNDRAAAAFIAGPGSSLELLLGATSIADFSDRIEFVDAVAESDAKLAQDVENLRNALEVDEADLERLKTAQQSQLTDAEDLENQIAADLQRQQDLQRAQQTVLNQASSTFVDTKAGRKEFQDWQAAQQPPPLGGGGPALPPGAEGILDACPVDAPRGFGDGFGAPRYVGGFHPHAGVDIVAPEGTPVRAPFDGYARDATNIYGGTSVIVDGSYGYVYNAHLGSVMKLGAVQAGDIIGTVSSTGLAGGTTPHDHFEFHPNVIPANWTVSYYGYSVIGSAINPYPLLVEACF